MVPYVPSEKTGSKDRVFIDEKVELLAQFISNKTPTNFSVLAKYKEIFRIIGNTLLALTRGDVNSDRKVSPATELAKTIFEVAKQYKYEGAFLGELNYGITRLIQRVPQIRLGVLGLDPKEELRYWLYAVTVEALIAVSDDFKNSGVGIGGVFEDLHRYCILKRLS